MDLTGLEKHPHQLELLPQFIDRIAHEDPKRTWEVRPPDDADISQGFEEITYSTAANAINRAAWFFERELGNLEPASFPIAAYLGIADLRCLILPLALVKVGYQLMILSELTSLETREYLFNISGCRLVACTASRQNDPLLRQVSIKPLVIPELDELLSSEPGKVYPYDKTTVQGSQ